MENFEEKLTRLEELSSKIKNSDLSLEEAVSVFEEGITLSKNLEKELEKIEKKVQILINQPSKQKETTPELDLFSAIE
ncbi:MAG: exodeoxyribonuclease VII small subunit [Treponemataceae bacterium]|nr:exodeoxyribonuclease VII small subunit [Treponemataceae bacterium]